MNRIVSLFTADAHVEALLHPEPQIVAALNASTRRLRAKSDRGEVIDLLEYAVVLISQEQRDLIHEGIGILEDLTFQHWQSQRQQLSRALSHENEAATAPPEDDSVKVLPVCYYYLAIGWTKLGDTGKALSCVSRMLQVEPNHPQGVALLAYLEKEQSKSAIIGVVGVTAAAAGLLGYFVSKR